MNPGVQSLAKEVSVVPSPLEPRKPFSCLKLGGSGIKKRGGGVATTHRCILRSLTRLTRLVFEESRSDACVDHVA